MRKALPAIFVVVALTLLVVVGVLAYNTGVQAGLTQAQNIRTEFFSTRSASPQGATANSAGIPGGAGGGLRSGGLLTVKSVQGNTIQATNPDGTMVTINVDAQTVYQKSTAGALSDIQAGARIMVVGASGGVQGGGASSASGPITARTIQIQPGQ